MGTNDESQNTLSNLDQSSGQLRENLTNVLEKFDEEKDIHKLAIQLSEIYDHGTVLLHEMNEFELEISGPGGEDDRASLAVLEKLQSELNGVLDTELPDLLEQRLLEISKEHIVGPEAENKNEMVYQTNMFVYDLCLGLLNDPAIEGQLLEPVFDQAFECAVADLDADGVMRVWPATSAGLAKLPVDKKWIAARPQVAHRIVKLYLAVSDHPGMRPAFQSIDHEGQDYYRLQELEDYIKDYDLLKIIGSPLREQYQKAIDKLKAF